MIHHFPKSWCINQGCHVPIPSTCTECPECGALQPAFVKTADPIQPVDLETLRRFNVGVLRVFKGKELIEQHVFSTQRLSRSLRLISSEQYAAAAALGGD